MRALIGIMFLMLPLSADVSAGTERNGNRVQGFELSLTLSKRTFVVGEEIEVRWTLMNRCRARTYVIPRDWSALFPRAEDYIHGSTGHIEFCSPGKPWVPRGGPMACGSGIVRTWAHMKSGACRSEYARIDPQTFLPPGAYDVKLTYFSHTRGLIAESKEDLTSNVLRIQIVR